MATIDEYRNRNGKMFRARVRRNRQTFTQVFSTRAAAKIWSKAQEGLVLRFINDVRVMLPPGGR